MNPLGLLAIALSLLVLGGGYWALLSTYAAPAIFSLFCGSAALVTMGWTLVLATRLPLLESLFGPLDRMYVLHKWLGIGTIVLVLLHDAIDAKVRGLADGGALGDFGESLGELSLDGLIFLVLVSVATFIPYNIFRWSHLLMGALFTAAALHFLFEPSPVSLTGALGLYLVAACAIGIAAWLYTLWKFGLRNASHHYTVDAVERQRDVTVVTMRPEGKRLSWRPGQFAFFAFGPGRLREVHPFSISNAPSDGGILRISVKALGGYTRSLGTELEAGETVRVSHAYGHFHRRASGRPEIWIAGGIGVAPFAALAAAHKPDDPEAHLFYAVRSRGDAVHLDELRKAEARLGNLTVHLVVSDEEASLTVDRIATETGWDLSDTEVFFCGPKGMRVAMRDGFGQRGLPRRRFHYEEFEIRSGIGLVRVWNWAAGRIAPGLVLRGT